MGRVDECGMHVFREDCRECGVVHPSDRRIAGDLILLHLNIVSRSRFRTDFCSWILEECHVGFGEYSDSSDRQS